MRYWKCVARYYVASLINVALLLFGRRIPTTDEPIYVFTHRRGLASHAEGQRPMRVGLYNLRYFHYPHVVGLLTLREWIHAVWITWTTYRTSRAFGRRMVEQRGHEWPVYKSHTHCGLLRHFDAVLHLIAFENHAKHVYFSSHFDSYVTLLSLLREGGGLAGLHGCQHGLFEHPPRGTAYEPMYVDTFALLCEDSRTWFTRDMCANPDCQIRVAPNPVKPDMSSFERRSPDEFVIAFGGQEHVDWDRQIVERIVGIASRASRPVSILLYPHPLYSSAIDSSWSAMDVRVYATERHGNIDMLVTRFSTLGLDYARQGVTVLFTPMADRACLFEAQRYQVCYDLDQMEAAILERLDHSPADKPQLLPFPAADAEPPAAKKRA